MLGTAASWARHRILLRTGFGGGSQDVLLVLEKSSSDVLW